MQKIPKHLVEGKCDYCTNDIEKEKWSSAWCNGDKHYKTLDCDNCGKKNWLNLKFLGSGHDCILKEEESELESMVRKVQEG